MQESKALKFKQTPGGNKMPLTQSKICSERVHPSTFTRQKPSKISSGFFVNLKLNSSLIPRNFYSTASRNF